MTLTEIDFLTKHERGVLLAALANYRKAEYNRSRKAATARVRAMSGANRFVADDLIRQLSAR